MLIQFNGWELKIMRQPRRRRMTIQIKPHSPVIIKTNLSVSQTQIEKFILEHAQWVNKHLNKYSNYPKPISYSPEQLKILKKELKLKADYSLTQKVKEISLLMSINPSKIKFRYMKTRWGTCSTRKVITLNTKLVNTPEWIQNSVIVHELAHIKFMNHSKQFWDLVKLYDPQYKAARKWLNKEGNVSV